MASTSNAQGRSMSIMSRGTPAARAAQGKNAKPTSSILRIVSALATGIALIVLPMMHANLLMERTIRATFPGYDVDYRATWPRILGGATASDVRVLPFGDDEPDEVYRFEHVTLKIPFFQFYRSMFKRWNLLGGIDDVEMVFEGGHGPMHMPLLDQAAGFGNASLTPFEAEGCLEDNSWIDDEFAGMGLPNEPLRMSLRLWREDGFALVESTQAKPGIGELKTLSRAELKDKAALLAYYYTARDKPISDEWHLRSEGFNAARNRHCARKDGTTDDEFVERHVFTVKRILEDIGMAPTAELEAAYRGFATRGGTLDVHITYGDVGRMVLTGSSNWGDLLDYLHTTVSINGEQLAYSLRPAHTRSLPESDDESTTFALLRREWDARQGVVASVAGTPAPAVATPAPPPSSAPAPVVEPVVAAETFLAPAEPAADAEAITDYRELGKHGGERYVVHFRSRPPMKVEILGMDGGAVRVRRNLPSGSAEHLLDRASFVRAERVR